MSLVSKNCSKYLLIISTVLSFCISQNVRNFNYCIFNKLCRDSNLHVGCYANSEWWGPQCKGYIKTEILQVNPVLIKQILDFHNFKRNQIAMGRVVGFERAARMATVSWDETLAYLAELNTRQCDMKHDKCRVTDKFIYSGQNLCTSVTFEALNIASLLNECFDIWFYEYLDTDMSMIESYKKAKDEPVIGHFTQLMIDRSTKVGCSISTYYSAALEVRYYSLACNYASTNVIGYPVYRKFKGFSECVRRNPLYPGLCHPNEDINPNILLRS